MLIKVLFIQKYLTLFLSRLKSPQINNSAMYEFIFCLFGISLEQYCQQSLAKTSPGFIHEEINFHDVDYLGKSNNLLCAVVLVAGQSK